VHSGGRLLLSFSLLGLRSDADLMLWRIGHNLDASGCLLAYRAAKFASPLLLLAERFGRKRDAGTTVLPRLTHEELAGMIASSRSPTPWPTCAVAGCWDGIAWSS
jgi:hypothetical protein